MGRGGGGDITFKKYDWENKIKKKREQEVRIGKEEKKKGKRDSEIVNSHSFFFKCEALL